MIEYLIKYFYEKQKEVTYVQEAPEAPAPEFDYKNFLDFGFFSNVASQYGGNHYPGNQQVIVEKTYTAPIHHTQKEVRYFRGFGFETYRGYILIYLCSSFP